MMTPAAPMLAPAVNVAAVPTELRLHSQWVCWRWEVRDDRPTKPPYTARSGWRASVTDPADWTTFENALAASATYDGIGFVLTPEDRFAGVDLDHCRDATTGALDPWAAEIVAKLRSYTEITPSQTGLRIFVRAAMPGGRGRKSGNLELYDRGRYLTVTGHHLPDTPGTIEDRAEEIEQLVAERFAPAPAPTVNGHHALETVRLDDQLLLDKARRAGNGPKFSRLWDGNTDGHPSHSEADLALCNMLAYWTGRDPEQMDRLFRQSRLFRLKWDDRHGEQTYGQRTISAAVGSCQNVYSDSRATLGPPTITDGLPGTSETTVEAAPWTPTPTPAWRLYDPAEAWDFPPVEFAVDHLLPLRCVVWWGGLPKRYKSLLLLYVCLAIACRRASVAGHFAIKSYPKILYISREDPGPRLQSRIDDICRAWGVRPEPGRIRFLIRPQIDLMDPAIITQLRDLCRQESAEVLVLDTWTALSPSANPIDAKDQAKLAAAIVQLMQDINGTVVVVDHSRKNRPDGQPLSSADIFGPLQKWAAAEHIVMLEKTGHGQRIEMFVEGKDADGGRFFVTVSGRDSGEEKFTYAGTVEEIADNQRALGTRNLEAVYRAVADAGAPIARENVRSVLLGRGLEMADSTIQKHLGKLIKAGRIGTVGKAKALRYLVRVEESPTRPSYAIGVGDPEIPYAT